MKKIIENCYIDFFICISLGFTIKAFPAQDPIPHTNFEFSSFLFKSSLVDAVFLVYLCLS